MSVPSRPTPPEPTPLSDVTLQKLRHVRMELYDEYTRTDQAWPWIVGFSGGKDSTLVLQLVIETLLNLPPSERTRPVHVVTNDTLVESPVLMGHINRMLKRLSDAAPALQIPLVVFRTVPPPHVIHSGSI